MTLDATEAFDKALEKIVELAEQVGQLQERKARLEAEVAVLNRRIAEAATIKAVK